MEPSHWIIAGMLTFAIAVLLAVSWMAWDAHKGMREEIRLTRAVAGLIYQEEEKTRAKIDALFGRGAG